jgi:hypothetical protein
MQPTNTTLKTYNVTVKKVSDARPEYYRVFVDKIEICEIKSARGKLFGFNFRNDLRDKARNVSDRFISDRDFNYGGSGYLNGYCF